ncbi:tetratricopeptide repeat protein [Enterococcus caccae]|uniref:Tetratricopeptide repeat protein n=1 Tax=Enterococcus caccae ATCC BAA-1240 TaxID=1158612 RepID=R3WNB7_9ENTE|nr:hypothetical protein [Enterococcus caccae]EOL49341.1 hypothetical protein UC7_00718 [Enterococcus caccae ATCC BAA-1240]EOT56393.1 hypothetical protein I580_03193 [Enterococcus caccae ATCC BAA-1240]OJG22163.1 hypothetical protein RU98_GL002264 [Enterococcus caccae]
MREVTNYANRDAEREKLEKSIASDSTKISIIEAVKACGVSSFISNFIYREKKKDKDSLLLYRLLDSDCELPAFILKSSSDYEKINEDFKKYVDKEYGEREGSLVLSALDFLPYGASLLKHVGSKKSAKHIYNEYDELLLETCLKNYFIDRLSVEKFKNVVLFLDHMENINERYFNFLLSLSQIKHFHLVFIQTEENDNCLKLKNFIQEYQIKHTTIDFSEPQIKLIQELAELITKKQLSEPIAQKILESNKKNIHKIVKDIRKETATVEEYTSIQIELLKVLYYSGGSLPKQFLQEIVTQLPLVKDITQIYGSQDLDKDLKKLQSQGVVLIKGEKTWCQEVQICVSLDCILPELNLKLSYLYEDTILEYFNGMNLSLINKEGLLIYYKIGKKLDSDQLKNIARRLVDIMLTTGEDIPKELIQDANLSPDMEEDCLISCIIYCKERKYSDALNFLEKIENNKDENYRNLRGVLLNRCRRLDEAVVALEEAIEQTKSIDRKCLLLSYLISSYIHLNQSKTAKRIFEECVSWVKESANFGYLLRNSVLLFDDSIQIYTQASEAFEQHNDSFGYATTLCNKGKEYCQIGNLEKAHKYLGKAEILLQKYGTHHSYALFNDLGIYYAYNEKMVYATRYFKLAKKQSKDSMPEIFADINQACITLLTNKELALKQITELEERVEEHPVDRVRQKYYINRLFIEQCCQTDGINKCIENCQKFLDRKYPKQTQQLIELLCHEEFDESISFEQWQKFYQPCYLVYWYVDPLKLVTF